MRLNIRNISFWIIGIIFYYIWFQAFYNMIAFGDIFPYRTTKVLLVGILYNFIPILLQFICNTTIVVINKIKDYRIKIPLDFILSLIVLIFIWFIFKVITHRGANFAGIILNDVLIFLIVETIFLFKNYTRSLIETQKVRQQAIQFQYDALKAQVNPHFLFNSLNILNSLVYVNPEKVSDFIRSLSGMYRYIMDRQNQKIISLREEMAFLDNYINILKMRYYDQFNIHINGIENIGEQTLIPYSLQMLIENVTKHNIISSRNPMIVDIDIMADKISISNHIKPRETNESTGVGLHYLTTLYRQFGKEIKISNDGIIFNVIIPFIEA